jgi:hypothetical protein
MRENSYRRAAWIDPSTSAGSCCKYWYGTRRRPWNRRSAPPSLGLPQEPEAPPSIQTYP